MVHRVVFTSLKFGINLRMALTMPPTTDAPFNVILPGPLADGGPLLFMNSDLITFESVR